MFKFTPLIILFIPAVIIGECAFNPFGSEYTPPHSDLIVTATVPDTVSVHEPFEITYSIANQKNHDVTLITPTSCIAELKIYYGGEEIPFAGTVIVCSQAITEHSIAAGETTEWSWEVRAELINNPTDPIPRGAYTLKIKSEVSSINDESESLPDVEQEFFVE